MKEVLSSVENIFTRSSLITNSRTFGPVSKSKAILKKKQSDILTSKG